MAQVAQNFAYSNTFGRVEYITTAFNHILTPAIESKVIATHREVLMFSFASPAFHPCHLDCVRWTEQQQSTATPMQGYTLCS